MDKKKLKLMMAVGLIGAAAVLKSNGVYAQAGNVGIGTISPTSTLHVNGSVGYAYTVLNSGGTQVLDSSMHFIYNNTGNVNTYVLPAANSCTGREYVIKTGANDTLVVAGGGNMNTFDQGSGILKYALPANSAVTFFAGFGNTWQQTGLDKAGSNNNIYNSDGTLTGPRTVTQAGNTLGFTGGNVGIGTTTPSTSLHVVNTGTGGTTVSTANTANTAIRLENTGNGQAVIQNFLTKDASGNAKNALIGVNPTYNGGNGILYVGRTGNNDLTMDLVTGNLGLGNGTPTSKLSIANTATQGDWATRIDNSATDNANAGTILYNGSGTYKGQVGYIGSTSNWGGAGNVSIAGYNGANIVLGGSATGGNIEAMRVDVTNSRVGIGNIAPGEKLSIGSSSATGPLSMSVQNTSGQGRVGIASTTGDYGAPIAGDLAINSNTAGKGIAFSTTAGNVAYITNAGNLGVGTTAPATNVHVVNAGTGGTAVTTGNTANMALRLENTGNGQAVIQNFLAKDASGNAKNALIGVNPTYNGGNGILYVGRTGGNDLLMDLSTGNVGVGGVPNANTLQVNGSLGAAYNAVTTTPYMMTGTDYYVVYNGAANGVINLPAAGTGTMRGRLYTIKNTTAAQTVTVTPNGAETIDGNTTIAVAPGNSLQLVSTGTTSGATWEVVNFAATTTSTGNTLYTGNGTLSGPRTVTLGGNNLTFASTGGNTVGINASGATDNPALTVANATGQGRLAVAGCSSCFGSFQAGDVVLNSNTTGKGIGLSTTGASNAMYVANNGNVGIGTSNPGAPLHLVQQVSGGNSMVVSRYSNGGYPLMSFQKAEGTLASPAAVGSGSQSGVFTFNSHNGTSFNPNAQIQVNTTEAQTPSAAGGNIVFSTTANGTTSVSERMRIDQNGNVGIGTTTPLAPLHISGTSTTPITVENTGANPTQIKFVNPSATSGWFIGTGVALNGPANFGIGYPTLSAPAISILQTNANVGILNATPSSKLHVGSSSFSGVIGMAIENSQGIGRIGIANATGDFGAPNAGDFMLSGNTAGKGIGFNTNAGTGMYMTNAGRLGIGTTAPAAAVEAAGASSWQSSGITLNNTTATTGRKFTVASRVDYTNGSGQNGLFGISDDVASQMRMVIDQNGQMGINNTSPTSMLDVNGTARIRTVNQVATAATGTVLYPAFVDGNGNVVQQPQGGTNVSIRGQEQMFAFTGLAGNTTSALTNFQSGFYGTFEVDVQVTTGSAQERIARFLVCGNNNTGQNQTRFLNGIEDAGDPGNAGNAITAAYSTITTGGFTKATQVIVTFPGTNSTITLVAGQSTAANAAFTIAQNSGTNNVFVRVKKIF